MAMPGKFKDVFDNYTEAELESMGEGYTFMYDNGTLTCEELGVEVVAMAKSQQEVFVQSDKGVLKLSSGEARSVMKSALFVTEEQVKALEEQGVFKTREWVPHEKM
jgi:hypothetical protein